MFERVLFLVTDTIREMYQIESFKKFFSSTENRGKMSLSLTPCLTDVVHDSDPHLDPSDRDWSRRTPTWPTPLFAPHRQGPSRPQSRPTSFCGFGSGLRLAGSLPRSRLIFYFDFSLVSVVCDRVLPHLLDAKTCATRDPRGGHERVAPRVDEAS